MHTWAFSEKANAWKLFNATHFVLKIENNSAIENIVNINAVNQHSTITNSLTFILWSPFGWPIIITNLIIIIIILILFLSKLFIGIFTYFMYMVLLK